MSDWRTEFQYLLDRKMLSRDELAYLFGQIKSIIDAENNQLRTGLAAANTQVKDMIEGIKVRERRIAGLEGALEKHRWIPVSEKLPESITEQIHHSQDVLIVRATWGVCKGYYQEKHQQWVVYGSYERPQEYQNEITHWKPIILPDEVLKKGGTDGHR